MGATVLLYSTFFSHQLPQNQFLQYCSLLPVSEQEKVMRFKRWEDAHACLLGKLLLLQAIEGSGLSLSDLKYTSFDKPYFDAPIDFNIAHSGNYVVCTVSDGVRVGVDIEQIKPIVLADFELVFTPNEWKHIHQSENQLSAFFHYWTRKEAVIKADGGGLNVDLLTIDTLADVVSLNSVNWHLQSIAIGQEYVLHLCSDISAVEVLLKHVIIG